MTDATPVSTWPGSAPARPRADAREKVLGAPIFAADRTSPDVAHAMLAVATIGRGRIVSLDTSAAEAVPGVRLVMTHRDTAGIVSAGYLYTGGYGFQSLQPMLDDRIAYRGQPIALVVADTLEAATEAAFLVAAEYAEEPVSVTIDAPGVETVLQAEAIPLPFTADRVLGEADAAFGASEIQVDATFHSAPQHHNPIEMISTVAEWRDDRLIIHEGSQHTASIRFGLATALGLDVDQIDVLSPYLGGSFGQRSALQGQTALVAEAARRVARPIKLVVPRSQIFHDATFRPETRHRIRIGGDQSGRLLTAIHEIDQQTSRHDLFISASTESTATLYGWEHFRGEERLVRTDTATPGYMRAPYSHLASFALESAVDEYAYRIGMDPVALRLANDTQVEPISGIPFSSRHVAACLERGAERFGWSARSAEPGSMVADDGSLIGWGVAVATHGISTAAAIARLRLGADGRARVAVAGHEMGQGIRTVLAGIVSEALQIPVDAVEVVVGDTRLVPQHLTAGSWGTTTSVPVVRRAIDDLLAQVTALDSDASSGRSPVEILVAASREAVEVEARNLGVGQPPESFGDLEQGMSALSGPIYGEFATFGYLAHFVEVRVEPTTRRVRVPRVVSVVDCGRVLSPVTAASQVRGGVVWGVGAALRERSEVDERFGGFVNADLGEYIVPVNADIGEIEVDFIDEPDPLVNADGVKGLGDFMLAGVAGAISNALFHATGRRLRNLPIRIEDLL